MVFCWGLGGGGKGQTTAPNPASCWGGPTQIALFHSEPVTIYWSAQNLSASNYWVSIIISVSYNHCRQRLLVAM